VWLFLCIGASGVLTTENAASPMSSSAREQQEEEWKTELARVCCILDAAEFLQSSSIACNAERCINHGNSVHLSFCLSVCHMLVLYPDE